MRFPVTQISQDLGYSKGVVSEYFNNKRELSDKFRRQFENHYKIKFSDFEEPPPEETDNNNNNPNHMRDLLEAKEETISGLKEAVSALKARIKDLERDNFFSTQSLPERDEGDKDKRAK